MSTFNFCLQDDFSAYAVAYIPLNPRIFSFVNLLKIRIVYYKLHRMCLLEKVVQSQVVFLGQVLRENKQFYRKNITLHTRIIS